MVSHPSAVTARLSNCIDGLNSGYSDRIRTKPMNAVVVCAGGRRHGKRLLLDLPQRRPSMKDDFHAAGIAGLHNSPIRGLPQ